MQYIALFEYVPGEEGFSVVFPDVPGCFSAGNDMTHAYKMAHEALSLHIGSIIEDGEEIPVPRTLERIKAEWEDWAEWEKEGNFMVVPITYIPDGKPNKYTIYMNSALMKRIDAVTDNRSAFLSKAAEMALSGNFA